MLGIAVAMVNIASEGCVGEAEVCNGSRAD